VDDLRTIAAQYAENFELAMVDKDKKLPDMIRDLDTNISRLNDQLMMLSAQLEEGIFVDALHITTPTPVLAELDKVCIPHVVSIVWFTLTTLIARCQNQCSTACFTSVHAQYAHKCMCDVRCLHSIAVRSV
jgi:hypothetical protein